LDYKSVEGLTYIGVGGNEIIRVGEQEPDSFDGPCVHDAEAEQP
jgi:hypothetical protein